MTVVAFDCPACHAHLELAVRRDRREEWGDAVEEALLAEATHHDDAAEPTEATGGGHPHHGRHG